MGMGFGSNYADIIEFGEVKALCPQEAAALENTLTKFGVSMEALAKTFEWEEPEIETLAAAVADAAPGTLDDPDAYEKEAIREITEAFETLTAAFARVTTVGDSHLDLSIGYHNAEDQGDRYDEVDGAYWAVGGLYQLTLAGRQFGHKVERQFFVTFG